MGFKRKNPGNQSIRRQLTFYMGFFVVLPLCLALMLLNFYLQKVTTENKINNETNLLSQIRDNADQMIEVTNYATSMLMTNKNTLKNLRTLEQDGDSYEIYQAKRELSNDISNVESSVLNAVNGKVAILTKTGYVIGSYALSRTETDYEKEQWYQEVLKNGRKTTYSTGIGEIFQEMTIYDNVQKYLYMGREILDYSGKNLGVMLIRLSETNIWGKLAASMVTEEGGAIYILDRNNNILMGYNEKYQKQLKELGEQESVKEISEKEIITGNLEDDFYYIAGELENASNKLVYLVPRETFLKENRKILQHILEMVLLVIGFTVCTMLYFSRRLARPLVEVTDEEGQNHFKKHPVVGADMTRKILRRLKFDNRTTDCCCKLVKEHDDRPAITERNVRRAMSRIGTELFPLLFEVKRADTLGQSMYKRAEKLEYIAEYERVYRKILADHQCVSKKEMKINGSDLIKMGVEPGPKLGDILDRLYEQVLDDPSLNEAQKLKELANKIITSLI